MHLLLEQKHTTIKRDSNKKLGSLMAKKTFTNMTKTAGKKAAGKSLSQKKAVGTIGSAIQKKRVEGYAEMSIKSLSIALAHMGTR